MYRKKRKRRKRKTNLLRITILLSVFIAVTVIVIICASQISKARQNDLAGSHQVSNYTEITTCPTEKILDVKPLCQMPDLPTGCEACSAAMVLDYIGIETDMYTVASILPSRNITTQKGITTGPDPEYYFIGSPFKSVGSFGCFENVITTAVNNYFDNVIARKVSGSLDEMCREYIGNDIPVMIWATMQMREIKYTSSWELENGTTYNWPGGEHCLVLIGYNEKEFYFNDPQTGETVTYEKELAQRRYKEMGNRAVIIKTTY